MGKDAISPRMRALGFKWEHSFPGVQLSAYLPCTIVFDQFNEPIIPVMQNQEESLAYAM